MGIKDVLGKLNGFIAPKSDESKPKEKVSPVEMELRSFQERQRQDEMKKQVSEFRKQDINDLLTGGMLDKQPGLLESKNAFNGDSIFKKDKKSPEKTNLLKAKNVFDKEKLSKAKGGAFFK